MNEQETKTIKRALARLNTGIRRPFEIRGFTIVLRKNTTGLTTVWFSHDASVYYTVKSTTDELFGVISCIRDAEARYVMES